MSKRTATADNALAGFGSPPVPKFFDVPAIVAYETYRKSVAIFMELFTSFSNFNRCMLGKYKMTHSSQPARLRQAVNAWGVSMTSGRLKSLIGSDIRLTDAFFAVPDMVSVQWQNFMIS